MDFSLTAEQKRLREEIIAFARRELNEGAAQRDAEQHFPEELWRKCGGLRLQGLMVPEEYGGRGLDPVSSVIALEALGYGCDDGGLVFAICAHLLACVVPVWKYGSEAQKLRYLRSLSNGELVAVNGMTEPGSGSDAFSMSTTAEAEGNVFRLNGTKVFASNGPVADLAVVYAMTDRKKGAHGGVSAFLVEKGTPGFRAGRKMEKMGLRSAPFGELLFDNACVPAEALLGGLGAGATIFAQSMEWERVCLVAAHVGAMERLLEQAIAHARTRKAFGQPIGKFQAVSHRIADMKVRLEASRLLTYRAASRLGRYRDVGLDASIAKLFVSESLVETALDAVKIFGSSGLMSGHESERALRDAVASTLYSGTSEVQRNIVARWLGL